ncbi:neutral zinc metallopeptidase [Amycolatopsis sp. 195334CR]|uniref:neutral zinc metallopeptidase n=1 Tax=Amycolatopsis sp. 195334CR TaxID=2814588 RepID=UPI001A8F4710|nr:neutral zinc metallopeptidase [Amycolatopsis sp. 195334CR]MBN6041589.1 neutral zinc metallopeptidase [Amycolatopsis sp. 195334CR]
MNIEPTTAWPPPPRNSPVRVLGVLVLVVAIVAAVALPGLGVVSFGETVVTGQARPAGSGVNAPGKPVYSTAGNPLLAEGVELPQINCQLPSLRRSEEQLQAYYEAAMRCLDSAWQPTLERAGMAFATPVLQIKDETESSCGGLPPKEEATAFYCPADNAIHMPRKRLLETVGTVQAAHLAVLAHEYGHHVQALSGIMEAAFEEMTAHGDDTPGEQQVTRRMELQANCFAGLFLASASGRGSVSKALAQQGVKEFENSIGSESHGTVPNQVKWAKAGFQKATSACNTFTAAEGEVR